MKPVNIFLFAIALFIPSTHAGSWSQESIAGMNVNLYTPTTAPALNGKRALMINLHGCAQTSADLKSGGNWQATADQYGMVVAIPDAPGGGVILGCWDYYDDLHTRSNKHNDNLIQLAQTLAARSALNIDANQVYLSGLSSGGAQTAVLACLAADIFAGVGINAAPAIGTSSFQIGSVATTLNEARNLCNSFAGAFAAAFATQLTSVIFGSADTLVATGYSELNAAMFASLYGASADGGSVSIPGGGTQTSWSDARGQRVSLISVAGMGHAWPAGAGSSGSSNYIDHASVNYPQTLTAFLFANNRRALVNAAPSIDELQLQDGGGALLVSGSAGDSDGSVVNVHVAIRITASGVLLQSFDLMPAGDGFFSAGSQPLNDGNYTVTVTAEDNQGATGSRAASVWIGPVPADSAPLIGALTLDVSGSCVAVGGSAVDPDNNLASVSASFDGEPGIPVSLAADGTFTLNNCELGSGSHTVSITARDSGGNTSTSAPLSFEITDAGITASLDQHINAGRLDYTAYASCYLTYGASPFTLFLGADQRWSDGGSCIGPLQNGGGGGEACTEFTSSTAGHVLAGRAELCGLISYCAVGSGDYLGTYSIFDSKTLAQSATGFFTLGSCP